MGCGSSSTKVESFTPDNKREDSWVKQRNQKSRKSSTSSSSSNSSKKIRRASPPPRSPVPKPSSASSNKERRGSGKTTRESSANTRRTYTVQGGRFALENEQKIENESPTLTPRIALASDNGEKQESANNLYGPFGPIEKPTETREERHERRAREIEAIRGGDNNRITIDNYKAKKIFDDPFGPVKEPEETREEKHERRVREIEVIRAQGMDDKLEAKLRSFNLGPLNIPPRNEDDPVPEVTVEDILARNAEGCDWVKFGKKAYSDGKIRAIIMDRCRIYNIESELLWMGEEASRDDVEPIPEDMRAIEMAYRFGVTTKELQQVLAVCHVANVIDIPRDQYMAKQKEFHEVVVEELQDAESESLKDLKRIALEWLEKYPDVGESSVYVQPGSISNETAFPVSQSFDPNTLRPWLETLEKPDVEIPADGAWCHLRDEPSIIDGEPYAFAEHLRELDDAENTQLDTSVTGEAGWEVIELGLFENDTVTDKQEEIWKSRNSRTNYPDDKDWMKKRRLKIFHDMVTRHEWDLQTKGPYCDIYQNIEVTWNELQTLSEQGFIPPKNTTHFKKKTTPNDKGPANDVVVARFESVEKLSNDNFQSGRNSSASNAPELHIDNGAPEKLAMATGHIGIDASERVSSARSVSSHSISSISKSNRITSAGSNTSKRTSSASSKGSRKGSVNGVLLVHTEDADDKSNGGVVSRRISSSSDVPEQAIDDVVTEPAMMTDEPADASALVRISSAGSNVSKRISSAGSNASKRITSAESNASKRITSAGSNSSQRITSAGSKASQNMTLAESNAYGDRIPSAASNTSGRTGSARGQTTERISSAHSRTSLLSSEKSAPMGSTADLAEDTNGSRKGSIDTGVVRVGSAASKASGRNSVNGIVKQNSSDAISANGVSAEGTEAGRESLRDNNNAAQNEQVLNIETADSGLDLNSPDN